MRLTIEPTDTITVLDGVECRRWNGTTDAGVKCEVFVHRVRAITDENLTLLAGLKEHGQPARMDVALDLEHRMVAEARALLTESCELHERHCTDPNCLHKANVLAWLAHALGAGREDVARFPSLLVDYDLRCRQHGGCDSHAPPAERRPTCP